VKVLTLIQVQPSSMQLSIIREACSMVGKQEMHTYY